MLDNPRIRAMAKYRGFRAALHWIAVSLNVSEQKPRFARSLGNCEVCLIGQAAKIGRFEKQTEQEELAESSHDGRGGVNIRPDRQNGQNKLWRTIRALEAALLPNAFHEKFDRVAD
jgi:hypothetical protein